MSIEYAKQFTDEVARYTEARRSARQVRNIVGTLNIALALAAQQGVRYTLEQEDREVSVKWSDCESKGLKAYTHVNLQCMQVLEANEPADWVLDKFKQVAREIANAEEETE